MADCRECVRCVEVRAGEAIMCKMSGLADAHRLPWFFVMGGDCDDFEPKPAPAPSPASADREGADALDVLREAREVLLLSDPVGVRAQAIAGMPEDPAVAELCERWGYGAVMDSAARQWRRKDRDGAHTTGAAAFTVRTTLALIDRAITAEEARMARPAVEDPRDALLRRCATDFARVRDCEPDLDAHLNMRRIASGALEALRAAGVEPAPAQEGKASR